MVEYLGCFFSVEELRKKMAELGQQRLHREIIHPHVTLYYRPERVDPELMGEKLTVRAVGYGNDGINEGLKVELNSPVPALQKLISEIPVPHITLSVSKRGKPVNTAGLTFVPIEPFRLEGTVGVFTEENTVEYKLDT